MATREQIPGTYHLPSTELETEDCLDGEVFEVLEAIGLAHVRTADGQIYGLNRTTTGIEFSQLRDGVRVRFKVVRKFHRVLQAQILA